MTIVFQRHILPAALALIFVLTLFPFIESVLRYTEKDGPAIQWEGVEVLTPIVRPGENLVFVYTRTHHHQCPADLRRFIMFPDGNIAVRLPILPGGGRTPDGESKSVKVEVPIPLEPDPGYRPWRTGAYIYRMTAVRFCKDRIEYDTAIPDVHFKLEVP
jgi:hypothetical protein